MVPSMRRVSSSTVASAELELRFEEHRVALQAHCYRMLASPFDAQDAVQETFIRAWRAIDRFEGRAAVRSWLYRIATNVCLDMLRSSQRRARPMDLMSPQAADAPVPEVTAENLWLQPVADSRVLPTSGDPAELAAEKESIRLAF